MESIEELNAISKLLSHSLHAHGFGNELHRTAYKLITGPNSKAAQLFSPPFVCRLGVVMHAGTILSGHGSTARARHAWLIGLHRTERLDKKWKIVNRSLHFSICSIGKSLLSTKIRLKILHCNTAKN